MRTRNLLIPLLFAALSASHFAYADMSFRTIDTELLSVRKPDGKVTVYSLLSTRDGRVYTVNPAILGNGALVAQLDRLAAKGQRLPVHLTLGIENGDDEVVGISEMSAAEARAYADSVSHIPTETLNAEVEGREATVQVNGFEARGQAPAAVEEARTLGFEPTVLRSMTEAQRLFNEQQPMDHDTQCHQRAMRWSYDAYKARGINSMKVMMFFTEKFQTTFVRVSRIDKLIAGNLIKPYKWWYHTAPYVYVGNEEVVLDSEFLPGPVTMDQWTHFFLSDFIHNFSNVLKEGDLRRDSMDRFVDKDHKPVTWEHLGRKRYVKLQARLSEEQTRCRVISNYREINAPAQGEWCLVRKLPMFYYMPESFQRHDCDPNVDPAPGRSAERFVGGDLDGQLKYPCLHQVRRGWNDKIVKSDLENMKSAAKREPGEN